MKFLSLCSGIDAASVASAPLGWECVGFSEIEPFPCAVLTHHYPSVTNYGDMNKYAEWPEQLFIDADAIVGGPPCQAFSMAGKREGLDDARGNLTLIYANLIDHADRIRAAYGKPPVWCLYENVPGLLSDRTNAFGCLLGKLAGEDVPLLPTGRKWTNAGSVFGPSRAIAWRILDAQYFGVAQRRRRVFVVAGSGDFNPAKVLFESEGVRRDSAPSREAGKGIAPVAGTLSANGGGTTRPAGNCNELDFCVATYGCQGIGAYEEGEISATLLKTGQDLGNGYEAIMCSELSVRRLVPEECEALQGFPRGFTRIPWKNKSAQECPDGPRYKSLGNSWAVPCARWIFERVPTNANQ